jgi:hypothetical protein
MMKISIVLVFCLLAIAYVTPCTVYTVQELAQAKTNVLSFFNAVDADQNGLINEDEMYQAYKLWNDGGNHGYSEADLRKFARELIAREGKSEVNFDEVVDGVIAWGQTYDIKVIPESA